MYPILFGVGSLEAHRYGVMVALAAVLAGYVLRVELQRRGAGRGDSACALTLAGMIGGFVGTRVYFLLEHLGQTSQPQLIAAALGLIGVALLILAPVRGARTSPSAVVASS